MSDADTPWLEQVLDHASDDDAGQILRCPNEDCGSRRFMVSQLATVGPSVQLGIACSECGRTAVKANVEDTDTDISDQFVTEDSDLR